MDVTLRKELEAHNRRLDTLSPDLAGREIRGGRVRLQGKSMLTHTEARAEEEANVRDYYQNLVRDLQRDLNRSLGPIRSSGHKDAKGFTTKLEDFAKDLDKHVESFGKIKVTSDAAASKMADEIMDSKPVSVNAPDSLRPHLTSEQEKQQTIGAQARQGTPQGGADVVPPKEDKKEEKK